MNTKPLLSREPRASRDGRAIRRPPQLLWSAKHLLLSSCYQVTIIDVLIVLSTGKSVVSRHLQRWLTSPLVWCWLVMVGMCRGDSCRSYWQWICIHFYPNSWRFRDWMFLFKYQIMAPTQTLRWNFCGSLMMKPQIYNKCWIGSKQQHSKRSLGFIILFGPQMAVFPWAVSLQILL